VVQQLDQLMAGMLKHHKLQHAAWLVDGLRLQLRLYVADRWQARSW
jgi:hypothetical protein